MTSNLIDVIVQNLTLPSPISDLQTLNYLKYICGKPTLPGGWPHDKSKCYIVKSGYSILIQERGETVLEVNTRQALEIIWKANVPSKLSIFGWRVLKDRLHMRKQLLRRGILRNMEEVVCVFCNHQVKEIAHVLLLCP